MVSANIYAQSEKDSVYVSFELIYRMDTALCGCNNRLDSVRTQLIKSDTLIDRCFRERDKETELKEQYKSKYIEEKKRGDKYQRKTKRTRRIGIGATIVSFIAGVLVVILI